MGGNETQRKVHLVQRDQVFSWKVNGGFDIRHSREMNQAYIMKMGWRLIVDIINKKHFEFF
jgi:hypothetical protein